MKPSEIVEGALETLKDETDWCRGLMNRYSTNYQKTQHCMLGALRDQYFMESSSSVVARGAVFKQIQEQYGTHLGIGNWNDTHTFSEVRMILEKTRANLEEQGQ